jgi:wyosine [tRNA(Phe)-imidazoG37] synthetase (radical SAM superfamily)
METSQTNTLVRPRNDIPRASGATMTASTPRTHLSRIETAFGCPREFQSNRHVYTVISARAGGLSVGVNMNPDQHCNFDCPYCEVKRAPGAKGAILDVEQMGVELAETLRAVQSGELARLPCYRNVPGSLLRLRQVALSGDGEPSLCPRFLDAVRTVMHVRARSGLPFFKVVLITNASGLDLAEVQVGLACFNRHDEIWAKLDAGTQEWMSRVNRTDVSLDRILSNILFTARQRPVVIQSLFALLDGLEPPESEIEQYVLRLRDLRMAGAQISQVQIYSATRPTPHTECSHLPLRRLSAIARKVREVAGLKADVF